MSPLPPPTHSDALGQSTLSKATFVACQALAPPPGSVLVTTSPLLVVAHSMGAALTQESAALRPEAAIDRRNTGQARNPPVGRAEVSTEPSSPTATQSVTLMQDIPVIPAPSLNGGCSTFAGPDQASGAAGPAACAAIGVRTAAPSPRAVPLATSQARSRPRRRRRRRRRSTVPLRTMAASRHREQSPSRLSRGARSGNILCLP